MAPFLTRAAVLVLISWLAAGCAAPLLVAGTAAGVAGTAVMTERRAPDVVLEDQAIESRIARIVGADRELGTETRISATSYNRVVLLTGQVPDSDARQRVRNHVRTIDAVSRIHDHLEEMPPVALAQRTRDTRTTARVKSELIGADGVPAVHVKVVTENDTVYLMGRLTREEALQAAEVARRVSGVRLIVRAFEYLD